MDNRLPMIVKFEIKEKLLDEFLIEVKKILEPTRAEGGCLLYELHQDLNKPTVLMFYEVWETVEAWKNHDTMPYILDFKKVMDKCLEKVTFNQLKIL